MLATTVRATEPATGHQGNEGNLRQQPPHNHQSRGEGEEKLPSLAAFIADVRLAIGDGVLSAQEAARTGAGDSADEPTEQAERLMHALQKRE